MFFSVKRAGGGPGIDPDVIPKSIINRVGTALRVGEVLMLDFDNQSYDTTATITGCLGNGVTPNSTSPSTGNAIGYLMYPMVLVTKIANSASGEPVDCIVQGWGDSIQTNSGAVAGTIACAGLIVSGTRVLNTTNAAGATSRPVMINRTIHTVGTGEETIFGYFCGNDGK